MLIATNDSQSSPVSHEYKAGDTVERAHEEIRQGEIDQGAARLKDIIAHGSEASWQRDDGKRIAILECMFADRDEPFRKDGGGDG